MKQVITGEECAFSLRFVTKIGNQGRLMALNSLDAYGHVGKY
jgi:hypothetical protein